MSGRSFNTDHDPVNAEVGNITTQIKLSEEMGIDPAEFLGEMPGGFFVYHADGDERLIFANKACLRIFGCDDLDQFKELTGYTFPGMVHPDDIDAIEQSITEQIEHDVYKMDYVEYRIIARDGSIRWIQDYGHYVQLDTGNYFYVFIDDATDRLKRRMNELEEMNSQLNEAYVRECEQREMLKGALKQANAANVAKTTFLNNMSHDIRTQLNTIAGYTQLISQKTKGSDDALAQSVYGYADEITKAADQLLDLVVETLEVSHFEAGRVQLNESEFFWEELANSIRQRFEKQALRKNIAFAVDASKIVHPSVYADEQRVGRIIGQLVDNAIKYTPDGGTVSVSLEELPAKMAGFGRYTISVVDNGSGMTQGFVDRMFNPFERESDSTQSGVSGTGLGLTIVKHSVDLLCGDIEVQSTPESGTKIDVRFSAKISSLPEDTLN